MHNMMDKTKIKICGIKRPEDVEILNRFCPDYAGFVFWEKSKRYIDPKRAAQLRKGIAQEIQTAAVLVDMPVREAARLFQLGIVSVLQLHGHEDRAYIAELRALTGPEAKIWKAVMVRAAEDIAAAEDSPADMVLLDNGYGTGQAFDWNSTSGLKRPFFLAGGLNAENVRAAIGHFHPFGVDVSSGVETEGFKDMDKAAAFIRAVRDCSRMEE